ncbi:thioredoxin-like protein [Cordyceps javanica]|uniref:Thioredoxin-like protein n=1 Tax=Cordyceps javanica TaxID=43265 RepID=A0A545UZE3_9HYPO|nr:thioredoxin-like protein [Cordyceps javanica]TQW06716.1 thioredoxin-like protein [Cordyceps javanica]
METLSYILLAIVFVVFILPAIFRDRSPIPETSARVLKVSEAAGLDAVLSTTTCVVVDFYADWCPPCRAIAPVFSQLAERHSSNGKLAFVKVNVDHVKDVAARYSISAMPTFVFFRDGVPQAVPVEGLPGRSSVKLTDAGLVDRVLGADRVALEAVVKALSLENQG